MSRCSRTRIDVSGPDVISEPGASATYTATFTPADTTYKDVTWSVTEPDGAPTYKAEISAGGVLRVNRLSGPVRGRRRGRERRAR